MRCYYCGRCDCLCKTDIACVDLPVGKVDMRAIADAISENINKSIDDNVRSRYD